MSSLPSESMTALQFHSTNGEAEPVGFAEALLRGQAPDRGLYLPDTWPAISRDELVKWKEASYADIATAILCRYTAGVLEPEVQQALCEDAYDYPVPLEEVSPRRYLLRLDRGPTASFKDFAARMMARWMGRLGGEDPRDLVILVATSGDTGSAVAHAYHGVPKTRVIVLYPPDEVSVRQRRQMTTLGGNVTAVAIDGKFDDCQALVKRAFADPDLADLRLTSANSINIGRLLPQSVYYVYAYTRVADVAAGEELVISVPSGNFGNMLGAVIARRMGTPIRKIIAATNANDAVPRFLESGDYRKVVPSRACISNAMNVGHPSNFARLIEVYGGWLDEQGGLQRPADLEAMRRDLYSISVSDQTTRETVGQVYAEHGALIEPHGAVGWYALERALAADPSLAMLPAISVETAHPAKFPDAVREATGIDPELPDSLKAVEGKPEMLESLGVDYDAFQSWLRDRLASN